MIAFPIRNPLITLVVTAAVAIAGVWAWTRLPVDALPDLSDNQVVVWTQWPGKSPEDVDVQITARLTRGLQGLAGVRTVRGLSLYGTSTAYVIFDDGRDFYDCRTRVLERLGQLQGELPPGVTARLGPDATAMSQVFAFTLHGRGDLERQRRVLDQLVVPALQAVPGVAEVAPVGGVQREYHIDVDPLRLEEQNLTIDELITAIRSAGRDVGAMSVEQSGVETMLRGRGFVRALADVEGIGVRGGGKRGAGLLLKDVATVSVGGAVRQGILADQDGERAGALIALRVGEDPQRAIAAIKRRLVELQPALAREGLTAVPFYDRSQLIAETRDTLTATLIEELATTLLVVIAFLLHVRASLVIGVTLPLGMLATVLVMHAAGIGANLMSLAGVAIAIGVMVDMGIVITESIFQHLLRVQERLHGAGEAMPRSPWDARVIDAVIAGTREVAPAMITSCLTTVIGFLPILFLDEQAGRLFRPLAITKSLAMVGASFFGLALVPMLARFLLPPWRLPPNVRLAITGVVAGLAFGWYWHGIAWHLDHARWHVLAPGWLAGPGMALLLGSLSWRFTGERLAALEANPVSHAIDRTYRAVLGWVLAHRWAFLTRSLVIAALGYGVAVGWPVLSTPLHAIAGWFGGDLARTAPDRWLRERLPGLGSAFLPPLDEGSLLFMPSILAQGGLGESLQVMRMQNRQIADIPEVQAVMGKLGRAETALDPAPIGMVETVVVLKPYADWPLHDLPSPGGGSARRPRSLIEVRAALAAASDIPGVAPSWLQPIETRVVMLSTGIKSLIAMQVTGDDPDALERFAVAAEAVIREVPGAVDVAALREGGKPYAEVRLDHERLARFGLSVEQVMMAVESALGGMAITWSVEGNQRYGLRLRYARERRDDPDELALLQVPVMAGKHGAIPLTSLVAAPQVHELHFDRADGAPAPEAWRATLPLALARNLTVLDRTQASATTTAPMASRTDSPATPTLALTAPLRLSPAQPLNRPAAPDRAELVLPAGTPLPPLPAGVTLAASNPHPSALTWTIGPMQVRSEDGKRVAYVLFNARGRAEVDVVEDARARVDAALRDGRLLLPAGVAPPRMVGRYEQKLRADRILTVVIAVSATLMILLMWLGTRSWVTTAIIVLGNVPVNIAGGLFLVWLWDAELTVAVTVGFIALLGVMFNDGILIGLYLDERFRDPPTDVAGVRARVLDAGARRIRPALMTNLTTLISLVPVLWSDGRGSELMLPMCLPIIGGMILDLLSPFTVPCLYAWWWERKLRRRAVAA